ncbi:MAG TPA: hypothetical protein VI542_03760 [Candidatus Tectomicrobia bacterium]
MSHTHVTPMWLVLAILGLVSTLGFVPVTLAGSGDSPMSTGVVATVTAIDATRAVVTLRTEAGEVFEHPQEQQWHVGHKVLCDRIDGPRPQLMRCKPWESGQEHTRAMQVEPAPRR